MVGCMVGTSLSMAPALILAQGLRFVDLDGPYLLARDRAPSLELAADGWMAWNGALWGG
jgi:L-alanine-DL-glutamate epimerase-like enolase superfamily enzyme